MDGLVTSTELRAAFKQLRGLWKQLYEEVPGGQEAEVALQDVRRSLDVVAAAARISEEAKRYAELAYAVRMGRWLGSSGQIDFPDTIEEVVEGVRSGFEMRLRTLRQMESGDEILPDAGRETRRAAARDLHFIAELLRIAQAGLDEKELERLAKTYDPRRRLVREELNAPGAALEAVEFLIRLGAD